MTSIFFNVTIKFNKVKCIDCGEISRAEPYLWIVYFYFDGNMVTGELKEERDQNNNMVINFYLERATQNRHHAFVWGMGASHGHGNIGGGMADGENRTIDFKYNFGELLPISLFYTKENGDRSSLNAEFKAYCGAIAILMEEDQTDDQIINNAYGVLRNAVWDALDDLLDNFKLDFLAYTNALIQAEANGDPPPETIPNSDISNMTVKIAREVRNSIIDDVKAAGFWDKIKNVADPDETLGSQVWIFNSDDLEEFAGERTTGHRNFESDVWEPRTLNPLEILPGVSRYIKHGKWQLQGRISAKKVAKIICFIATAAYGSPIAPQVNFLRYVRDRVLKKTKFGSLFVHAYEWIYYKFSPQVAVIMEQHHRFKSFMKWIVVNPIVYFLIGIIRLLHRKN